MMNSLDFEPYQKNEKKEEKKPTSTLETLILMPARNVFP